MTTFRYGLIGSGMMGHEHIRNLALFDDAQVVAVSDPDDDMRASAATLAGGATAYSDHRALLAAGGLDALVIAAPNHIHHAIMMDVLDARIPILCEKPLGISDSECAEIEQKTAATGTRVWVAMEYRYMAAIARLIEEVRRGTAGTVRMLSIREHRFPFLVKVDDWNRFSANTGGTLVEKCCHFFDLMCLILESEPVRVYASGGVDVNHLDEVYDGRVPDILDNAYVVVEFASGARAMLDLCMYAEGSHWQEVIRATGDLACVDAMVPGPARFMPDGKARASAIAISRRSDKIEHREDVHTDGPIMTAGDHHGSTYFQHEGFLDMLRTGGAPKVTVSDGRRAVAIGAAAEESARTHRVVDMS